MENHYNCIYMYTNKINGKRYVGQTVDFNRRHKKHISDSYNEKRKYQYNVPFHCAIRKYGIENFKIQILAENIPTQEKMNEYEIFFIKRYNTLANNKKGYNVASGGSNGNAFAGKTEEEMNEIRQKQSEAKNGENNYMYGKHHTEETKQKISENACRYWEGKHLSEEHKQKISEAHKDKKFSEETKQKISDIRIKKGLSKGENNPMYGKHHSDETKRKMSENHADFSGKNHPKAKRVAQYDKQGNLIKIWDYIKQASEELGIHKESISACCRGKCKTAGGYIWHYAKETE